MAVKFNPFTGQLQIDEKGSGGGASYIDGEVATYNDLPLDGTAALNSAWLVRTASGTWLLGRKPAGIYIRTATAGVSRDADYTYAGILPDVFSDANFLLYDNGDSTKNLQFHLSGISTGATRTLTVPNASGTIALTSNFAAPPAIGSTTPAAGSFTTLSANNGTIAASAPALNIEQTWNGAGVNFIAAQINAIRASGSSSSADAELLRLSENGTEVFRFRRTGQIVAPSLTLTATAGNTILGTGNVWFGGAGASPALIQGSSTAALDLRNSTVAMDFRIYGTFTSSTNYQRMTIKSVKQTLSALSGASATTTGTFIPDGAVLVGVTTRVATALTGATGYTIGDGTDADRWGDITGTAIGTTSDNRDWTAATIECFTAGGNITLTAKTSNFTAGAIEVCVFYLAGEAD